MILRILKNSGIPIYVQIVKQIEDLVILGGLSAGDGLPTIRTLAKQLLVNPNTVSRAYCELESKGLVEARQGSGTRVSSKVGLSGDQGRREIVRERVEQLVSLCEQLGLSRKDLASMVEGPSVGIEPEVGVETAWRSPFDEGFID